MELVRSGFVTYVPDPVIGSGHTKTPGRFERAVTASPAKRET